MPEASRIRGFDGGVNATNVEVGSPRYARLAVGFKSSNLRELATAGAAVAEAHDARGAYDRRAIASRNRRGRREPVRTRTTLPGIATVR
jgi:hypothetical protein